MKILSEAGVEPEHKGKLLLRKRQTAGKPACNATQPAVATRQRCGRVRSIAGREAWIFTNNSNQELVEEIAVKGWDKVEDLLEGPLAVKSGRVKIKVKSLDVKVLIVSAA